MDDRYTHQFAFDLGTAQFAEDLTEADLLSAMSDIGFAKPSLSGPWVKLLRQIADPGIRTLAERGGKQLADGITAQMQVVSEVLGRDLPLPERDYFPRTIRDDRHSADRGGWGGLG